VFVGDGLVLVLLLVIVMIMGMGILHWRKITQYSSTLIF